MCLTEGLGVADDECKVSASAGARHFPCEDVFHTGVLVDVVLYAWLDHGGEEGDLGFEGGLVGVGEGVEVGLHDSLPTLVGGGGQGFDVGLVDDFPFDDGASRASGEHGNHAEVAFQPAKDVLVGA